MVVENAARMAELAQEIECAELCWYCLELLDGPRVCWHGISLIWLHPECAQRLGRHLMKDAYVCLGVAA